MQHDDRPLVGPDRQADRRAQFVPQILHRFARGLHDIDIRQSGKPKMNSGGAKRERVAGFVADQKADAHQAHEIEMQAGRAHARLLGQIAQGERARRGKKRLDHPKCRFDGLDPSRLGRLFSLLISHLPHPDRLRR